jgi:hypothetical protein
MNKKYAYWLEENRLKDLLEQITAAGFSVTEAKKAVCTPLSKKVQVGVVPPEAWRRTELCKRQLSWYWTSEYAGLYLLISSFALENFSQPAQIILQPSSFRPKKLPDEKEQREMINRKSYLENKPQDWDNFEQEDSSKRSRWMRLMGIRGIAFEDLFLTHCANHANFIEPVYYLEENEQKVPYSIAKTKQVCSACLEFFNILGADFQKKLVVPCPGAVMFAGLPVNKYIEVLTLKSN